MYVELVNTIEQIAVRIGCSIDDVWDYMKYDDFPEPVNRVGNYGKEWDTRDIDKFIKNYKIKYNLAKAEEVVDKASAGYLNHKEEIRYAFLRGVADKAKEYKGYKLIVMRKKGTSYLYARSIKHVKDGKYKYLYLVDGIKSFRSRVNAELDKNGEV